LKNYDELKCGTKSAESGECGTKNAEFGKCGTKNAESGECGTKNTLFIFSKAYFYKNMCENILMISV
jgi:hypothetical protein